MQKISVTHKLTVKYINST